MVKDSPKTQAFKQFLYAYFGSGHERLFCMAFGLKKSLALYFIIHPDKIPDKMWRIFEERKALRIKALEEGFERKVEATVAKMRESHNKKISILKNFNPDVFREEREPRAPRWLSQKKGL